MACFGVQKLSKSSPMIAFLYICVPQTNWCGVYGLYFGEEETEDR